MPSQEERMVILRMIEEGKITPEEGARLLAAIGERGESNVCLLYTSPSPRD